MNIFGEYTMKPREDQYISSTRSTEKEKSMNDKTDDVYANDMDWGSDGVSIGSLKNYRQYQYDLIGEHIGTNILEVGSGASRSFTKLIVEHNPGLKRVLSIEPSEILMDAFDSKSDFKFPKTAEFQNCDVFDLDLKETGKFDTVLFIHVLEHIKEDRMALNHVHQFLEPGGKVLIEVPAIQSLFSVHDEILGHHRRYSKKTLKAAIDTEKYKIHRIWYNDFVGILGSFYYFKLRKVKLKDKEGEKAFNSSGAFYDKFIIPFQKNLEKVVTPPIGLSLNVILEKI